MIACLLYNYEEMFIVVQSHSSFLCSHPPLSLSLSCWFFFMCAGYPFAQNTWMVSQVAVCMCVLEVDFACGGSVVLVHHFCFLAGGSLDKLGPIDEEVLGRMAVAVCLIMFQCSARLERVL